MLRIQLNSNQSDESLSYLIHHSISISREKQCFWRVPEDSEVSRQKYGTAGGQHPSLEPWCPYCSGELKGTHVPPTPPLASAKFQSVPNCGTWSPNLAFHPHSLSFFFFFPIPQCFVYFFPFLPLLLLFFQELGFGSQDCFVACQRACSHKSCLSKVLNSLICGGLADLITAGKTWSWELAPLMVSERQPHKQQLHFF